MFKVNDIVMIKPHVKVKDMPIMDESKQKMFDLVSHGKRVRIDDISRDGSSLTINRLSWPTEFFTKETPIKSIIKKIRSERNEK